MRECLASLTSSEIEIEVGDTLANALEKLRDAKYEAILLDLCLSDSEGIETFARVHEQAPNLPIVISICRAAER